MNTDLQLLSQYHQRGDALAFRELVISHSGMVFATARRITQDEAMAEDVAQETFVKLARQSRSVTESVAAWLHRVAARLACNAVRKDSTRRRNEEEAVAVEAPADEGKESPWNEVEPELDAIIEELPEEQRAPLVMHFLQGRSQRDIARELNVNQSTVSRAVESGLIELRKRLRARGVFCGAALGSLLLAHTASATAPVGVVASLCKVGMAGIGGGSMTVTAAAATGAASMSVLKIAAGLVITAGVTLIGAAVLSPASAYSPVQKAKQWMAPPTAPQPVVTTAAPGPDLPPSPPRQGSRAPSSLRSRALPAAPAAVVNRLPVHELVHSFPQTLQRPFGAMVLVDGWVWGTTSSGGEYGCGTIFKVRPNGKEWAEVVIFSGRTGQARGYRPRGLILARDGTLWGATETGGDSNGGTLFCLDRSTRDLKTVIDFGAETDVDPGVAVAEAPDGSIWGTTATSVFRYDRAKGRYETIARFTGAAGELPGMRGYGGLAADENGLLWGTTMYGGRSNAGTLFKVDPASRVVTSVAQFTGKTGALPGNSPDVPPTPDGRGSVWGVTRYGGATDDGVVYQYDVAANVSRTVVQFTSKGVHPAGTNPMAALAVDEDGHLWGSTRYLSGYGKGTGKVFRVDRNTGRVTTAINFSGMTGSYPGGPLRGPMLRDGAGGFIGLCNYGGKADFGTLFHFDVRSSRYTLLYDLEDLTTSTDGADPRGRMIAASDGSLWGVAENDGAHHFGAVFKIDPVTDTLTTIVDFTGSTGAFPGSHPRAGLTSDGHGFMWGVSTGGGLNGRGTIFKIEERTGAFRSVHEFGLPDRSMGPAGSGPETELVDDHQGYFWGTTKSGVFKVNMQSGEVKVIARFKGDRGPYLGTQPEALALDNLGYIWGAALGEPRTASSGSLFKINTATNEVTVVESLKDARRGTASVTYRQGDMTLDAQGNLWYAGAYDRDASSATRTLLKINPRTSSVESWHRDPNFSGITTPVMDDRGLLWGLNAQSGTPNYGAVYCFDPASKTFTTVMNFTGAGSQARSGEQPERTRFYRHTDGNLYAGTRFGGPGNGGTIFRLRFGPTPITQEATLLAGMEAELHGTLKPNGRDSEAAFEWGTDPTLKQAATLGAGTVAGSELNKSVASTLKGLKSGTTYYYRLRGKNDNNRIPQRGAVLSFTTPVVSDLASAEQGSAGNAGAEQDGRVSDTTASAAAGGHRLTVVRIPGAGAGFVRGALEGPVYEVGKRYTLTALPDNGYIFSGWSVPGIAGAQVESRQLSFVFTEALAKSPVITATFVKNPFHANVTGVFQGLVLAADAVAPDVSTTGAIHLTVSALGGFTGELRYDRRRLPLMGTFDIGGLSRFGPMRMPSLTIPGDGEHDALVIGLQLDLSTDGSHGISGTISTLKDRVLAVRSIIEAERGYYDGVTRVLDAQLTRDGGMHRLSLVDVSGSLEGRLMLSAGGHAAFATRLRDGTGVLAGAALSQQNRAAFFTQLYAQSRGSVGGAVVLGDLFGAEPALRQQPFWWCQPDPGPAWQDISVELLSAPAP